MPDLTRRLTNLNISRVLLELKPTCEIAVRPLHTHNFSLSTRLPIRCRTESYHSRSEWMSPGSIIREQSTKKSLEPKSNRIHILGASGSVGCLIAHSLVSLPREQRPPISLLFHRQSLWEDFSANGHRIRLIGNPDAARPDDEATSTGFDVEILTPPESGSSSNRARRWIAATTIPTSLSPREELSLKDSQPIEALILTVKGAQTVSALRSVQHRLRPSSTILFIQNGMGQLDEVNERVFGDPSSRPKYLQGILSHGIYLRKAFTPVHAATGTLKLGLVPSSHESTMSANDDTSYITPSTEYLLNKLLLCTHSSNDNGSTVPDLHASVLPPSLLFASQLQKLAVNAVVNSLTAILDIRNGQLGTNPVTSSHLVPQLCREISSILTAILTAILKTEGVVGTGDDVVASSKMPDLSPNALEEYVRSVIYVTQNNSSSTREDLRRNRRETEIGYINGYLARRAEELNVDAKMNEVVWKLIEAATWEATKRGKGGEAS